MIYGEINIGDILELKTFGSQSTKMVVTGHGEKMQYGAKKGDEKKFIPTFYIRSLSAFDDEPRMVEIEFLRQHCTRVAQEQQAGDDGVTTDEDFESIANERGEPAIEYDEYSQGEAQDYSQADNRTSSDDDPRNRQAANAPEKKPLPLRRLH